MQEFVTRSGARAIRTDGGLFQHLDLDNPHTFRAFTSGKWHQDLGDGSSADMPPLRPVQIRSFTKGMFFDGADGPVLVAPGDFVARDAEGEVSRLPAERVRDHVILRVSADAPRKEVEDAGRLVLERTSRIREAARSGADGEVPSPISIREDDKGRALLVSNLPDGREKTWKAFAWKEAAEAFLADGEKYADLRKRHEATCRSIQSVNDTAHAFRMDRKAGLDR